MSVGLWGGNKDIPLKWWTFPGGERGVRILDPMDINRYHSFTINCKFQSNDDLIDIMMLVDACRAVSRLVKLRLCMPYFPYARQDRVMMAGEPFALGVAAGIIKSCDFEEIEVWDPHSDVLYALFPTGNLVIRSQWDLMKSKLLDAGFGKQSCLVSPDAGALKKIYKLAKELHCPVIECSKVRDVETGGIKGVSIGPIPDVAGVTTTDFWIVDDICDGGATFIGLAEAFNSTCNLDYDYTLNLAVTHGIFSKGREILNSYFDKIINITDLEKHTNV